MSIWIDIIFFYLPVVLGFFEILFYRKCVEDSKIPRITWLGLLLFFVPGFGAIVSYVILISTIVFVASGDLDLKEDSKFVKNWLMK